MIEPPPMLTGQPRGIQDRSGVEVGHGLFPAQLCVPKLGAREVLLKIADSMCPRMVLQAEHGQVLDPMVVAFGPWVDVVDDDGASRLSADAASPSVAPQHLREVGGGHFRPRTLSDGGDLSGRKANGG